MIVAGDGTVDGRVVVGAPPDVVDAYLADVGSLRRHNKNVTSVDVTAQGDCQLVDTTAKSIVEMSYVARRCPTNSGWVETLLDSEMMTDYYAEWFVTPVPNGIEIRFRLRTEMDLPVPSRMVRGAIKKSVFASLDRMQGTLGGPDAPPRQVAEE
ncbi:MAG: SRPBCC family protein [Deltaproteobacteria bacterium]|nr:SRPBCC family protein [Deltaproteobacteria bacterium]